MAHVTCQKPDMASMAHGYIISLTYYCLNAVITFLGPLIDAFFSWKMVCHENENIICGKAYNARLQRWCDVTTFFIQYHYSITRKKNHFIFIT